MTIVESADSVGAAEAAEAGGVGQRGSRVRGRTTGAVGRAARSTLQLIITIAIVLVAWVVFLRAYGLSPLVGKSPAAVWAYLFSGPESATHRSAITGALGVTLTDAAIGFVIGLAAGVLVATVFTLSRALEQTFLPVALMIRSVPFVAMTPVIVLVFGRGSAAVAVISGLVVFFPTLINMAFGLRSASALTVDLVRAYGGGSLTRLRKVALPSAMPSLFASAKIAVPGALIGALLAEWLATGRGLGSRMLNDGTTFQYADLWASVAVLTVVSTLLYFVVGVVESIVLERFGSSNARRAER
jgi:ABC-type nitrate/sulfonate/bicarbonate transport system permease component